MISPLVVNYPHHVPTMEPRPLCASAVWALAEALRAQVAGPRRRLKLEATNFTSRCRRVRVNETAIEMRWELGRPPSDPSALGMTEHDPSAPGTAIIYLNVDAIGGRDDLLRSTAAHELGHVVFETPAWMRHCEGPGETSGAQHLGFAPVSAAGAGIDWREWRANEFMGAFLAPRALLQRELVCRAGGLSVALAEADGKTLAIRPTDSDAVDSLIFELADTFGVSESFMEYRLRKYGHLPRG